MAIHKTVGQTNRDARNTTIGETIEMPAPQYIPPNIPWVWDDGRRKLAELDPFPGGQDSRWIVPLNEITLGLTGAIGVLTQAILYDADGLPPIILINGWQMYKLEEWYDIPPYLTPGGP